MESDQALALAGRPTSRTAGGLGQRQRWNAAKLSISLNMKNSEAVRSECAFTGFGLVPWCSVSQHRHDFLDKKLGGA